MEKRWHVDYVTGTLAQYPVVVDENGKTIAKVTGGVMMEEAEEYANLMAAAPEMREALEKIEAVTKHLMLTQGYEQEKDWLGPFIHTIQDIARGSIAGTGAVQAPREPEKNISYDLLKYLRMMITWAQETVVPLLNGDEEVLPRGFDHAMEVVARAEKEAQS